MSLSSSALRKLASVLGPRTAVELETALSAGGSAGVAGIAAVKNNGTDAPPGGGETPMAFVADTAGIDSTVATLAAGKLTVLNDGIVFFAGDFGPATAAPLADAYFEVKAIGTGGQLGWVYTLPTGQWDATLYTQFLKVSAGDEVSVAVVNNDPEGTATNNFYFSMQFAFVGGGGGSSPPG